MRVVELMPRKKGKEPSDSNIATTLITNLVISIAYVLHHVYTNITTRSTIFGNRGNIDGLTFL